MAKAAEKNSIWPLRRDVAWWSDKLVWKWLVARLGSGQALKLVNDLVPTGVVGSVRVSLRADGSIDPTKPPFKDMREFWAGRRYFQTGGDLAITGSPGPVGIPVQVLEYEGGPVGLVVVASADPIWGIFWSSADCCEHLPGLKPPEDHVSEAPKAWVSGIYGAESETLETMGITAAAAHLFNRMPRAVEEGRCTHVVEPRVIERYLRLGGYPQTNRGQPTRGPRPKNRRGKSKSK